MKREIETINRKIKPINALDATLFISSSYDDYIAARVLINNDLIIQGVALASSAIEKYLKAILKVLDVSYNNFHLESRSINKVKRYFYSTPYRDVFLYIDPNFLTVLCKAYDFRYHDNLGSHNSIGFIINQFLGELDFLYSRLECAVTIEKSNGAATKYKRATEDKDEKLFENNFVLAGIDKKSFMERPSRVFLHYYLHDKRVKYSITHRDEISAPYDKTITLFTAEPELSASTIIT